MSFLQSKSFKQALPLIILLAVLPIILVALPEAVRYLGKASGVPANLIVDAEAVLGPMPRPWQNLAQGGEEKDRMFDDVAPEIKALGIQYIRIDHVYDQYDIVKNDGGKLSYDWTKLDPVIKDILNAGAKPFIALSYMPPAISKGDIIEQPRSWGDWQAVVRATVEHISGTGGLNIADVYYEVWNEPDLFGGWKTYGDKNYLNLYLYSARGAQQASKVQPFKIGGPATTALYFTWIDNLLKFAKDNNLPLDFVSWHRYDYDLSVFEKDIESVNTWVEAHPDYFNLEFDVTEWGHDPKVQVGYDTTFSAAHTMAAARVMMGSISKAFVFEIKDGPGNEQYWGRWGLLTHEKFGKPVKKPRYRALEFLNTLGDNRVSVDGEGSWVKSIAAWKGNQLQTLIVNYDSGGKHTEAVPVTFESLPSGNFVYQRTDFMGSTGGSRPVATSSASWKTTELLKPNSAAMITLSF